MDFIYPQTMNRASSCENQEFFKFFSNRFFNKREIVFPTRSQLNARICDNIVAIVFGSTTTRSGAFVFLDLEVLVLFAGVY